MKLCLYCAAEIPDYQSYCSWDCQVGAARAAGGRIHTPNGLPIQCIKHDNLMLECEHGDHPDYKFPATVRWEPDREVHAVIYFDDSMVLTLYECCYAMWSLQDGGWLGGSLWNKHWRLDLQSIRKFMIMEKPLHD